MHTHLRNIKPLLMFVSVLSFVVSLVFTVKLLSSQAVTGADKVLFGGLALSAEFGKVILFSLGMILLFVLKRRSYSWLGIPLLMISLAFTILSVIGTLGALQVSNAEKTEVSVINSDKYNLLKKQIESLDEQARQLRKTAANQPSTWKTHNDAIQAAQKAEEEKTALIAQLQSLQVAGTGAQNALYVALAEWTGSSVEETKFKVMASYGIGLEALALFCALFAFFGDYLFGNKRIGADYDIGYVDEEDNQQNLESLALENQQLRQELEFYHRVEARRRVYQPKVREVPERKIGFTAQFDNSQFPSIKDYINVAWENIEKDGKDHLTGRSKIAKKLQIAKGKANEYHKFLRDLNLVHVSGTKTYPNVSKNEMIKTISNYQTSINN